ELDPNHPAARSWKCHTLNAKGRYADSLLISEKVLQTEPTFVAAGYAYAKSGQRQKAEDIINRLKEAEKTQYVLIIGWRFFMLRLVIKMRPSSNWKRHIEQTIGSFHD